MIRNLLYSLFLHSLLVLLIYLNFNFHKIEQNDTKEIVVSLSVSNGEEKAAAPIETAQKEEEKKEEDVKKVEETKEAESPKISEKNIVKKAPKKLAKTKAAKAVKKEESKEKIDEFKPKEKEEVKQKDAKKLEEDKTQNHNEDKKQTEAPKKEEDLGAKKESEEKSEEKTEKNPKNQNINELANSLENIDLSSREKFNIQSQLKYCYSLAIKESKFDGKTKVITKVQIDKSGKITFDFNETVDKLRYDNPDEEDYRKAIANIERALDLCSPLRNLPLDKHYIWKEIALEFGE